VLPALEAGDGSSARKLVDLDHRRHHLLLSFVVSS
jgi:hypothetical protein